MRRGGSIQVPDGHPVHDLMSDVCSVPSVSTAKLGTPRLSTATVRVFEFVDPAWRFLVDGHLGVGQVVDERVRLETAAACDDEDGQGTGAAQVGAGHPASSQWRVGRHPDPCHAVGLELAVRVPRCRRGLRQREPQR